MINKNKTLNIDSDSDSEFEEVFKSLKKRGVKTEKRKIEKSPAVKTKEARKQLFNDKVVTPVKKRQSEVSEKSDDSLEYNTPLKKLQLDILLTQDQIRSLQKQTEKTPKRRRRAGSEDSEESKATPAKKTRTGPSPKREVNLTPVTKKINVRVIYLMVG